MGRGAKLIVSGAVIGAALGFVSSVWVASAGDSSPFDTADGRAMTLFFAFLGSISGFRIGLMVYDATREDCR